MAQTQTIRELLDATKGWFAQKGFESARLDAELLLADALQLSRMQLYLDLDRVLNEEEVGAYRARVKRRGRAEPVAYILGEREFYGRPFNVSPAVLIPRPDTESVVEACLELLPADEDRTVIDVGTGSGCIAVTLACERPRLRVLAIDVSDEALAVARTNAEKNGVQDRVQFVRGDMLQSAAVEGLKADRVAMIVSNPPYIAPAQMEGLMPDVRDHEPRLALEGVGDDGLGHYRTLLKEGPLRVAEDGALVFEIGFDQAAGLSAIACEGVLPVEIRKDLGGNDRIGIYLRPKSPHQRGEGTGNSAITVEAVADPVRQAMEIEPINPVVEAMEREELVVVDEVDAKLAQMLDQYGEDAEDFEPDEA